MIGSFGQLVQYAAHKNANESSASRLPNGYYETAGNTTTGSKYIDTGLKSNVNDEYIITCARANDTDNLPVLGDGASKTDSNIALWINPKTNLVEFTYGNGGSNDYKVLTSSYNVQVFHTYRMEVSTGKAWLDDDYIGQSKSHSNVTNSKKLVFLGSWRGSTANGYYKGTVSEFIIIRNGETIRHFVPAIRKSDSACGYYDLCESASPKTGTPFYLPNTGTLTAYEVFMENPDENSEIQFDVNIESAGGSFAFDGVFKVASMLSIGWGDGTQDQYA